MVDCNSILNYFASLAGINTACAQSNISIKGIVLHSVLIMVNLNIQLMKDISLIIGKLYIFLITMEIPELKCSRSYLFSFHFLSFALTICFFLT